MIKISSDRKLGFGKYCGFSVNDIIDTDPQYFEYMSSKVNCLFNEHELQRLRNIRSKSANKDIHSHNVKTRTKFEEEMYSIFGKETKTQIM